MSFSEAKVKTFAPSYEFKKYNDVQLNLDVRRGDSPKKCGDTHACSQSITI